MFGDGAAERKHRGLREQVTQLQRKQVAPGAPVAVVEGVDVLEEKVAERGSAELGHVVAFRERDHVSQQLFDPCLRLNAPMDDPAAALLYDYGTGAKEGAPDQVLSSMEPLTTES